MNKKDRKKVIAKLLESWYSIDSTLLNGHASECLKEGKIFHEYIAMKSSMLSNLCEYWAKSNYVPKEDIPTDTKSLVESAVIHAKRAKESAARLLKKESVKKKIKNIIMKESARYGVKDLNAFSDKIVLEKHLEASLDNLLIGIPILESKTPINKCSAECKILENAHKMMRSSLVRLALGAQKVQK